MLVHPASPVRLAEQIEQDSGHDGGHVAVWTAIFEERPKLLKCVKAAARLVVYIYIGK
jgi:hypothetical protein